MTRAPKLLIIYSDYYQDISTALMNGATNALEEAGAVFDKIEVPGVLEIPAALAMCASTSNYDGYVLLGCVIRGETSHYEIVAFESARSIMKIMCENKLALGNGIQTVENHKQAWARADIEDKNKGGGAARAALAMIEVRRQLVK